MKFVGDALLMLNSIEHDLVQSAIVSFDKILHLYGNKFTFLVLYEGDREINVPKTRAPLYFFDSAAGLKWIEELENRLKRNLTHLFGQSGYRGYGGGANLLLSLALCTPFIYFLKIDADCTPYSFSRDGWQLTHNWFAIMLEALRHYDFVSGHYTGDKDYHEPSEEDFQDYAKLIRANFASQSPETAQYRIKTFRQPLYWEDRKPLSNGIDPLSFINNGNLGFFRKKVEKTLLKVKLIRKFIEL